MKSWYSRNFKLGVLGGGQLGRLLLQESPNIDVRLCIMDKDPNAPASRLAHEFCNEDILDYEAVLAFGQDKDVLTVEIENVNIETQTLQTLSCFDFCTYNNIAQSVLCL
jgi:5-(carboxyamino)imidazole ribonucleotide synthase